MAGFRGLNAYARELIAKRKFAVPTILTYYCDGGRFKIHFVPHPVTENPLDNMDFSALNLLTSKLQIEILPDDMKPKTLIITVAATEAVEILGGQKPSSETFRSILRQVCARKQYPLPSAEIPGGGGKSKSAQGQTKKPGSHSHEKHK